MVAWGRGKLKEMWPDNHNIEGLVLIFLVSCLLEAEGNNSNKSTENLFTARLVAKSSRTQAEVNPDIHWDLLYKAFQYPKETTDSRCAKNILSAVLLRSLLQVYAKDSVIRRWLNHFLFCKISQKRKEIDEETRRGL